MKVSFELFRMICSAESITPYPPNPIRHQCEAHELQALYLKLLKINNPKASVTDTLDFDIPTVQKFIWWISQSKHIYFSCDVAFSSKYEQWKYRNSIMAWRNQLWKNLIKYQEFLYGKKESQICFNRRGEVTYYIVK